MSWLPFISLINGLHTTYTRKTIPITTVSCVNGFLRKMNLDRSSICYGREQGVTHFTIMKYNSIINVSKIIPLYTSTAVTPCATNN